MTASEESLSHGDEGLPEFLTLEDALLIHERQLQEFGGTPGVRDAGLINSALAQAQASFGGKWLHPDLCDKAAAYFFYLIRNHGFVDGNKRVGVVAAAVFLDFNGFGLMLSNDEMEQLALDVADGKRGKDEVADAFRQHLAAKTE